VRARPTANGSPPFGAGDHSIRLDVPPEVIESIAQRAAAIVLAAQQPPSPWLDAKAAAEHLCCSPARVYDLVALGRLHPRRDGRRLLFRRLDLDAYLETGG
jgi:excisionase family DNA binding protein